MTAPPLTDRQRQILDHIRTHTAQHGYPPSIRELGQAVGLHSPSAVAYQLGQLARLGAIRRAEGQPRALVVVDLEPQTAPRPSTRMALPGGLAPRQSDETGPVVPTSTPRPRNPDLAVGAQGAV